jgi:hypothetical protein
MGTNYALTEPSACSGNGGVQNIATDSKVLSHNYSRGMATMRMQKIIIRSLSETVALSGRPYTSRRAVYVMALSSSRRVVAVRGHA